MPVMPVMKDHVTGLEPRGVLEATLARDCGIAARPTAMEPRQARLPMALTILDVVGLKTVNEQDGFLAGDAILRAAAKRLQKSAASASLLARLGGDELVAVFYGRDAAKQAALAALELGDRSAPPPLRAAAVEVLDDDTPGRLIERLYATLRRC